MLCGIVIKHRETTSPLYRPQKPGQNTRPHHWKHNNHQPGTSGLQLYPSATQALEPSQLHFRAGCDRTDSCWLGGCGPGHSGQLHTQTCNQTWGCSNMDGVWPTATKFLCSRYQSKVACSCTATSGFVDSHDFIAKFAVPGIVIHVLVPVARWLGKTHT